MEQQLIVRLEEELKDKLSRLSRAEGKSTSQVVRELIEQYIVERDFSGYAAGLWQRIGAELNASGSTVADVPKAIRAVRKKS